MSPYIYSVVLLCPADRQADANRLACAIGHDVMPGNTFSVHLSANGEEPATHFGCHAVAMQSFVDLFMDAAQGMLPDIPWGDFGLTEQAVLELVPTIILSAREDLFGLDHFEAVLADHDLQRIGSNEIL